MSEVREKAGGIRSEASQTVTPHLVCAGAANAIDFYKRAFGAKENIRLEGINGMLLHASIRIGDSNIMIVDEWPEWGSMSPLTLGGSPVTIHLYVDDVDAFVKRAVEAGAILRMPVQDMFWGDRYGAIEDPYGHKWSVATHVKDMSAAEIEAAMKKLMPLAGASSTHA